MGSGGQERQHFPVNLSESELQDLRRKLRAKVRHHLGGACPDMDDIVQESMARWIRAQKQGKVEHPENPGAFLSGVCNRVIFEYHRRIQRHPEASETLDQHSTPGISQAEDLELRDAVAATMSQLLERDCRILTDLFLRCKPPEEVCAENGIPESHLRVVVFRAKARFREIYMQQVKQRARRRH